MLKGWQGGANVFIKSMEQSSENAVNITVYHLNKLEFHQGDGQGFADMFNDFKGPATTFIANVGIKTGDKEAQTILTADFEAEFKDMSTNLDNFDSITRGVHAVGTLPYKLIMGRTRDRFYDGSYEQRIGALTGMSTEMGTQAVPLGVTAVDAYITNIKAKHDTQHKRMDKVGNDTTSNEKLLQTLIKKLNKNRGYLLFAYGDDDDCQAKVNNFFPLNILGDRSVKGHYQLLVPKADFRRICIHTFNPGEKVNLVIGDADVWISTADNANSPITAGYLATAGSIVTVDPTVFGDLEKKFIIATNASLTTTSDVIFNIIAAPKA